MVLEFTSPLAAVLDRHPLAVRPETPVTQALALMHRGRVSYLAVVEPWGQGGGGSLQPGQRWQWLGVFAESDAVRLLAEERDLAALTLGDATQCLGNAVEATESLDLGRAIALLYQQRFAPLPVNSATGQLLGAIAPESLARALHVTPTLRDRPVASLDLTAPVAIDLRDSYRVAVREMARTGRTSVLLARAGEAIATVAAADAIAAWACAIDADRPLDRQSWLAPVCCQQEDSWWSAYQLMQLHHVRHLAVKDPNGAIVGLLDLTDLLASLSPEALHFGVARPTRSEIGRDLPNPPLKTVVEQLRLEIFQRQVAQKLLHFSEERFRQAIETMADWVWEMNAQGVYTYASPRIRDILGYEPAEIVGTTVFDTIDPAQVEAYRETFGRFWRDRRPFELLKRTVRHRGGRRGILESSGVPLFSADGEFRGYRGVDRDITEREQARQKLEQLNQSLESRVRQQTAELRQVVEQLQAEIACRVQVESALRESERRLENILNSLNDVVWSVCARTHQLLYLNPVTEVVFGRTCREFLECPDRWLEAVHPADRDRVRANAEQMLTLGWKDLEYRIVRPDGEVRWLHDRGQLSFAEDGQPLRIDGIARDITDRKQIEAALSQTERRFRAIFDQTFQYMAVLTVEGAILEVNQTTLDLWGISAHEAIGCSFWDGPRRDLTGDRPYPCWSEATAAQIRSGVAAAARGEFVRCEIEVEIEGDRTITLDISIEPIRDDRSRVVQLIVEGRDLSDRKALERELAQREQLLHSFFTAIGQVYVGLSLQDERLRYLQVNQALADIHGVRAREAIGKTDREIFPAWADRVVPLQEQVLHSGEPLLNLELSFPTRARPQKMRHWMVYYFPVPLNEGSQRGVGTIILDITERQQAEQDLRAIRERLEHLLAVNPTVVYSAESSPPYATTFISENVTRLLGYDSQDFLENPAFWVDCVHPDDAGSFRDALARVGRSEAIVVEYRFRRRHGSYCWVRDQLRLIRGDRRAEIVGCFYDITESKKAEARLKASLQEKEVLLKEIHHRVKNNLQVISSLLNLQSRTLGDPQTRQLFYDSQNRIQSIAFIHEKLYQSQDLARVDFSQYIKTLTNHLFRSYGANIQRVSLKINIHDIFLGVDVAIPCGLIVNELVSNALKHGFPGDRTGEIWIALFDESALSNSSPSTVPLDRADPQMILTVGDNGVGLPQGLSLGNTQSLGMQLVNTLVKQLKGSMELRAESGTVFRIVFPVPH
jgi:PAS domain S-box-containing protein